MVRRLSQMYYVLTSISGVCFGMNCILFFFCVYVLWGQKSGSRRVLLLASTVQFCLCVAQTGLYINYLMIAFTRYPSGAESYFEHTSGISLACYIIFIVNFAIEGLLLSWRVFVIYNNNFFVSVPLILLLALQVGLSGVTAKGFVTEPVITGPLRTFNIVTRALIAAVNTAATVLICVRLYLAHRRAHAMLSQSKYKSTIIVVVECGALVTICTVAVLILYAVNRTMGIAGLGITTQVATMAPLLIIARYGIMSRQDERRLATSQMPLRISVMRTEDTHVDAPIDPPRKMSHVLTGSDSTSDLHGTGKMLERASVCGVERI